MEESPPIPWLRTALVAEDHEVIGNHVLDAVKGWCSREARLVSTHRELEQRARELGPDLDLIVADLRLADGDCRPVLSLVRRLTPSVRVVLMTGELTEQQRMDLVYEARPHVMLSKPFDCAQLYRRLLDLDPEAIAAGWYYDLARARGLESAHRSVRDLARDHALRDSQGDVSAAAKRLRVSRSYMYKLIARKGAAHDDPKSPHRKR